MMKNSKFRRILLLLACAVLLVSLSVGATLAYLTSTTDIVENTFTVGNVNITLDEEKVDEYGKALNPSERTVDGNKYNLVPGHVYTKDPTVTVKGTSEDCYVRMIVTINNYDKLVAAYGYNVLPQELVNGTWDSTKWPSHSMSVSEDKKTAVCEFRYAEIVPKAAADTKLEPLFKQIKLDGEKVTEKNIGDLVSVKIDIVANAIQSDSFNGDVDAAWAAFDGQYKTN